MQALLPLPFPVRPAMKMLTLALIITTLLPSTHHTFFHSSGIFLTSQLSVSPIVHPSRHLSPPQLLHGPLKCASRSGSQIPLDTPFLLSQPLQAQHGPGNTGTLTRYRNVMSLTSQQLIQVGGLASNIQHLLHLPSTWSTPVWLVPVQRWLLVQLLVKILSLRKER